MTIVPENGTVLCERLTAPKSQIERDGLIYEAENLPTYRIVSSSARVECFSVGDEIVCDSTGTKLDLPDGKVMYLFKTENIACKMR